MALSRKFLAAMGIEEDKIDEIISAHTDTVNGLKDKLADAEGKAKKADDLQQKLEDVQKQLDASGTGEDEYKEKYETLKKEYDDYKADVEAKEVSRKKNHAYRELLKEAGISDKRYDAIMKVTDLAEIELDGDTVKDKDKVVESIKTEWSDFVVKENQHGANTANPPANNGGGATMTKEQIRAIKDPIARQKAMLENPSVSGLE